MYTETAMLDLAWPRDDFSRIQYRLYHDASIYEQEHERIFRGPTWSLLCLEAEIPNSGDFVTTHVGQIPVVVNRMKLSANPTETPQTSPASITLGAMVRPAISLAFPSGAAPTARAGCRPSLICVRTA
jgi:hypothetical protein